MTLNINWSTDTSPSFLYSRTFWFPDSDGQRIMDILNKYEAMEINLDEKTVQSVFDKQEVTQKYISNNRRKR